ncbi:MAG: LytTR family DNA-binding domain-containing protein [Pseudomonadota bacterium]
MRDQEHPDASAEMDALIRRSVLSWPCAILCVAMVFLVAVFTPGGVLSAFSLPWRLAIVLTTLAGSLGWSLVAMPWAWKTSLRIGWPPVLLQSAAYAPFCLLVGIASAATDDAAGGAAETLLRVAWYFGAGMTVIIVAAALGLMMFQLFAGPERYGAPPGGALWRFRPRGACRLQPLLPQEARGRVLRMSAENQYVRVTTEAGEALVRCSLAEAGERVASGAGLRVHRSHWVAVDHVERLGYQQGNLRATLRDGAVIPVGRAQASALKARLDDGPRAV